MTFKNDQMTIDNRKTKKVYVHELSITSKRREKNQALFVKVLYTKIGIGYVEHYLKPNFQLDRKFLTTMDQPYMMMISDTNDGGMVKKSTNE